jgi:sialidase-1
MGAKRMTPKITVVATGLVYRNPKPYLRSIVAYHPSLVLCNDKELVATFDLGQAVESLDYHTVVSRSSDEGKTWDLLRPILAHPPAKTTHSVRTTRLTDGSLIGLGALFHREDTEAGLLNRENFGFVRVDLFVVRSQDQGRSWTAPESMVPPLDSPAWEVCHPIIELKSGRWLAPTATWRGWDGKNPAGEQTVALISDDRGKSWPRFGRIFDGRETGHSHLEVSVVELPDERILAVAWKHDAKNGVNFPTEYGISEDGGGAFSQPMQTGFDAQTCKILLLRDGRILCAYRRNDRPGLWATLAELDGGRWRNLAEAPLWTGAESGMTGDASAAEKLSSLKFGYPSMKQLPGGDVLLLFWCREDCITNIRWIRIGV